MKPASNSQPRRNLAVTLETTQRTGGAKLMAGCAIDRAVQGAMRFRQGTGRNLRRQGEHQKAQ